MSGWLSAADIDALVSSLWTTLLVVSLAILAASVVGILLGVGLYYGNKIAVAPIRIYVDIVRGTPALVIIFAVYYIIGFVFDQIGYTLSPVASGILALTLAGAADVAEITRGAIGTVHVGIIEAGKASGLKYHQIFFNIIGRPALIQALPPWTNTATELVKGATLLSLVGVGDLVLAAREIIARRGDALLYFVMVGVLYMIINLLIQAFARVFERVANYPRA